MKNFLKTITIFILGIPYVLMNVIINLVFNPIDKLKRKITSRRYSEFVSLYNDRNFFVYKNKLGAEKYIENEMRPFLPKNIIFVNLNENNEVAKYAQIVDILKREINCYQYFSDGDKRIKLTIRKNKTSYVQLIMCFLTIFVMENDGQTDFFVT